jgi:hypothetical protein
MHSTTPASIASSSADTLPARRRRRGPCALIMRGLLGIVLKGSFQV